MDVCNILLRPARWERRCRKPAGHVGHCCPYGDPDCTGKHAGPKATMCPAAYVCALERKRNNDAYKERERVAGRRRYRASPEEMRERTRAWREANRDRDHEQRRAHRAANQARIAAIKLERGCADCGYNAHPAALDFDHRPGVDKKKDVSDMFKYAWKTIEAEIAKCDVRCANCHRVVTAERRVLDR